MFNFSYFVDKKTSDPTIVSDNKNRYILYYMQLCTIALFNYITAEYEY